MAEIFGYSTPEATANANVQEELTAHNLDFPTDRGWTMQ